jgi:hypothetical protein
MKKLSLLFVLAICASSVMFTGCEKLADELDNSVEVTIHAKLEAPITAVPSTGKFGSDGYGYNESAVLDPATNGDLADYLTSIDTIDVESITILVTSVSSNNLILENSTFTITDNENGSSFSFSTPANSPITVGTIFHVDSSLPGFNNVNLMMDSLHSTTVNAVGSVNQNDFSIGYIYGVGVRVVASP